MSYWNDGVVLTVLVVLALHAGARELNRRVSVLAEIGLPASIIAGVLAFVFGPPLLGWLPLVRDALESGVYHALPVVFIALSLETPSPAVGGASVRSMALGITTMIGLQSIIGLAVLFAYEAIVGDVLHPGFGLLLPLGFEQGPGQALAMGDAWETSGLTDGRQIGLLLATAGFGWAIFAGVPLVWLGRRRGWIAQRGDASVKVATTSTAPRGSVQDVVLAIGFVYLLTFGVCAWGERAIAAAGAPELAKMFWSLHYMVGALLAVGLRAPFRRAFSLDDHVLGDVAGVGVDTATIGALAAIEVSAMWSHVGLLVALVTVGGLATLVATVWLSTRAFERDRFEHCVLWFGMSTGTVPVGLALLRQIDPELRSSAPSNVVLGSAACTLFVVPMSPGLQAFAVSGWSSTTNGNAPLALALLVAYLAGVVGLWWWVGGLHLGDGTWGQRSAPSSACAPQRPPPTGSAR